MNKSEIFEQIEKIALNTTDNRLKLDALIYLANTYETKDIMKFFKDNPMTGEQLCLKN